MVGHATRSPKQRVHKLPSSERHGALPEFLSFPRLQLSLERLEWFSVICHDSLQFFYHLPVWWSHFVCFGYCRRRGESGQQAGTGLFQRLLNCSPHSCRTKCLRRLPTRFSVCFDQVYVSCAHFPQIAIAIGIGHMGVLLLNDRVPVFGLPLLCAAAVPLLCRFVSPLVSLPVSPLVCLCDGRFGLPVMCRCCLVSPLAS